MVQKVPLSEKNPGWRLLISGFPPKPNPRFPNPQTPNWRKMWISTVCCWKNFISEKWVTAITFMHCSIEKKECTLQICLALPMSRRDFANQMNPMHALLTALQSHHQKCLGIKSLLVQMLCRLYDARLEGLSLPYSPRCPLLTLRLTPFINHPLY